MNVRLSRFFSYYKPYRAQFAAVLIAAAVTTLAQLAFPMLIRIITGGVQTMPAQDVSSTILRVVLGMLLLLLIQAVASYYYDYHGHSLGAKMERDMRAELFAHYEKLSFSYHDGHKPGEMMSRLTNDLLNLAELAHHGPENIFIYGLKFVGAVIILLTVNPRLTLVSLGLIPFMVVFILLVGRRMYRAMTRNLEAIGDVNAFVEENLSGIRVVKSFANERMENERFRRENDRYCEARRGIYRVESHFSVGITVMAQLIMVAVVGFGGIGIAHEALSLPDLITFLLYVNYLVEPITSLAFTIEQYQEGIAGFARFVDVLDTEPDIEDAPGALPLVNVQGGIHFDRAAFRYRDDLNEVLTDLTLDIRAGETIALVGYSGVGKTTLCSLIPRFYELTGGDIAIDGQSIRGVTLDSLRRSIGLVQQDVYLFSGTVIENIRYGRPNASDADVIRAAKAANADNFIDELPEKYYTDIGRKGVKLSGGQRQRISIARAFLKDPPILILDEATSSLDNESERKIRAALEVLAKGRTTIIIAHRLSTVRNADRIVVLGDGGIAETGTHAELIGANGVYARLYGEELEID